MSATTPALIAAAAGVGFGHAVLPDHWLPLAVVGRTRGYPLSRVARLSGVAGVAHVLVSVIAGAVVVAVGVQLRSAIENAEGAIVGGLLIATGVAFAALELTGHGHSHAHGEHHHHHHHDHDHRLGAVMVPFGAAASPDLTILPVLLAAAAVGTATAIASLIVFAVATIATIVTLTLAACFGGYRLEGRWLDRWGNALTAFVLVLIGLLVLTGVV